MVTAFSLAGEAQSGGRNEFSQTARRSGFGAAFGDRSGRRPDDALGPGDPGHPAPAADVQEHAAGQGASDLVLRFRRSLLGVELVGVGRTYGHPFRRTPPLDQRQGLSRRATDTIPVKNFVAPANVIDRSKEAAADPDYLLTVESIKSWEAEHGAIEPGVWVLLRTDWYKRNASAETFLNADATGPDSPGPTAEAIEYLISKGIAGWGSETVGTDAGSAGGMNPPFPRAYADAQGQSIRACEPLPFRIFEMGALV